jgi:hypothetical protein
LINKAGERRFPYGEDAQGRLTYLASGMMSVHLMKKDRTLFQSPSVFAVTPEEAMQSYHEYTSYCGTYKVYPDRIIHQVQMHACPNWVNTEKVRYYQLEDDFLYLSHAIEDESAQLVWRRG